jgi:transcriptional regulator with XRE-family HTH domain
MAEIVNIRQLRAGRALAGWTQEDLGQAMGLNGRMVRFWERKLPTNARKLALLEKTFKSVGIQFVSNPAVGVFKLK